MESGYSFRLQFHPPVEVGMIEIGIGRRNQLLLQARIGELIRKRLVRRDAEHLPRRDPTVNMKRRGTRSKTEVLKRHLASIRHNLSPDDERQRAFAARIVHS